MNRRRLANRTQGEEDILEEVTKRKARAGHAHIFRERERKKKERKLRAMNSSTIDSQRRLVLTLAIFGCLAPIYQTAAQKGKRGEMGRFAVVCTRPCCLLSTCFLDTLNREDSCESRRHPGTQLFVERLAS